MSNTVERDGRRYCYRCALIHELDGDKDRQIEELRKRVAELEQQISVANL